MTSGDQRKLFNLHHYVLLRPSTPKVKGHYAELPTKLKHRTLDWDPVQFPLHLEIQSKKKKIQTCLVVFFSKRGLRQNQKSKLRKNFTKNPKISSTFCMVYEC